MRWRSIERAVHRYREAEALQTGANRGYSDVDRAGGCSDGAAVRAAGGSARLEGDCGAHAPAEPRKGVEAGQGQARPGEAERGLARGDGAAHAAQEGGDGEVRAAAREGAGRCVGAES